MKTADNDSSGNSLKERIRKFYDTGSPYYLAIYGEHFHDGYYLTGQESRKEAQDDLVRFLAGKAEIKKGTRVLDVGCGVGGSSLWLANNLGAVTLGITNSPVQIEIARRLAAEQKADSQFLLMDAEKMHFDQSFDVIWAVAALTHFPNQDKILELATPFLDQHGRFVVYDWVLEDGITDFQTDPDLRSVSRGMLLGSLSHIDSYRKWFTEHGCRVVYAADLTSRTIKTWDDALSVLRDPAAWKLIPKTRITQLREFFSFFKGLGAMKLAMQKGKLKSAAIVAEKI